MKRVLAVVGTGLVVLLLLSLAYLLSPLSKRTTSLRVEVSVQDQTGHRAFLVNQGYLPVVIGTCDRVSDAQDFDTTVGDAIERWDNERRTWVVAYQRNSCTPGESSATFSHKLLWPGARLHTSPYFRWSGDSVIRAGDSVRFLVYTQSTESGSPSMPSQPFVSK